MAKSRAVQEIVKEVAQELQHRKDSFSPDEEFDPTKEARRTIIGRAAEAQDEKVIDELLASVPQNQGYYLKLYKEVAPNQFEIKQRIDNYDGWTDMEWEVTSIVRANTKKLPDKWGSGRYRIVIWKDTGVRGTKYKPIDFVVDAEEMSTPKSNGNSAADSLSSLSQVMQTVKELNPTASPTEQVKFMSEAFTKGLEVAKGNGGDQNMMITMMTTMMSSMMTLVSTILQNNKPQPDPLMAQLLPEILRQIKTERDPIEQLKKLKEAGIIPNTNSPTDTLSELKKVAEVVQTSKMLLGSDSGGDKSTVAEVLSALSPHLGNLLDTVKEGIQAVKQGQRMRMLPRKGGGIAPSPPTPEPGTGERMVNPPPSLPHEPEIPSHPFLRELYEAVEKNSHDYFPRLVDSINYNLENGKAYLEGWAAQKVSTDQVSAFLSQVGGQYFSQGKVKTFLNSFITWYRKAFKSTSTESAQSDEPAIIIPDNANIINLEYENHSSNGNGHYPSDHIEEDPEEEPKLIAVCKTCQTPYGFENIAEWDTDNKICDNYVNGQPCGGQLQLDDDSKMHQTPAGNTRRS